MATKMDSYAQEVSSSNKNFNFDALEKLGYAKKFSEKRVQLYEIISNCSTELIRRRTREDVDAIIAGSRGEGMCVSGDSDADVLFIQRNVKCTDNLHTPLLSDKMIVTFYLDFENVPSGYSKLRLLTSDNRIYASRNNIEFVINLAEALVERNGYQYLRNDMPTTLVLRHDRMGWIKQQSVFDDVTGPARTLKLEMPMLPELFISLDCVLTFKCEYPSVVDDWCKRERKHSWPDKDLIEKVKKLDVLVVPAGCKGSADEELQWRISLTLAEQALVHSFNDIQIKLFAALRIIGKQELKPICENITSYVLKNLLFWTFENTEIKDVTKDTFNEILLQLLEQLRMCINWKYLRSYMIPSKNMLQYKIFENERVKLVKRLNLLIQDGRNVLFRCPMVKQISALPNDELEQMIAFREIFEQEFTAVFLVSASNPEITAKIWDNDRKPEDVIKVIIDKVLPIIRMHNPKGLFNRLISLSNESISYCLINGITRGYHKS
ncbi:uncharacterized protein LOC123534322 [Mercenaria mercenaria]|uniref:uncharacterized protein LOC123534322 n=1 Tax=Mercenaria mercenaria TaxID=6596 RepID=UPI00234E9648|nr:uncharacterized protein LOC123534322 [Mercenaria mercenaria]XP_045172457.2 uncharacterized protein LOC123534322 [Mercenaria mercenaria]XP_045172459.2 uncharacterized protein LOC123534322 [Mercenaria mercenaria]